MGVYNGTYVHSRAIVRNSDTKTLHASAAVTANGNTANGIDVSAYTEGLLVINISAVSGTSPTANFYLETYDSLSNTWIAIPSVGTIAQQTAVTATPLIYAATNFGNMIRLRWVIGGTTPSFTFTASFIAKS